MSQEETTLVAVKSETLVKEPFTLVRNGNQTELFYRGRSCGTVVDGDTQSLAYVIDEVTDQVHNRVVSRTGDIALAAAGLGAVVGAVCTASVQKRKPWYKRIF
jgi:hypothetical protein